MDVMIVDDEPLARERLARLLQRIGGHRVVGEAGDGPSALARLAECQPQVVLLDVRMPGPDGLSIARQIAALPEPPAVIFCTAYGDHAIEAFEASATGYLLKPVSQDKLAQALQQASRVTLAQRPALTEPALPGRQQLQVHSRRGTSLLEVDQIRLLQADQKYVSAWLPDGEVVLSESLRELEDEFGPRFLRIHRNALVAAAYIDGIERRPDGESVVRLKGVSARPQVSRRCLPALREWLSSLG